MWWTRRPPRKPISTTTQAVEAITRSLRESGEFITSLKEGPDAGERVRRMLGVLWQHVLPVVERRLGRAVVLEVGPCPNLRVTYL